MIAEEAGTVLAGCRVLLVEDEYYIADDIARALRSVGAEVVGPFPTCDEALKAIAFDTRLDGAVLDINLRGEMAFPVVDALRARRIPVVFSTGYHETSVPPDYQDVPRWEKPFDPNRLVHSMPKLLRAA